MDLFEILQHDISDMRYYEERCLGLIYRLAHVCLVSNRPRHFVLPLQTGNGLRTGSKTCYNSLDF